MAFDLSVFLNTAAGMVDEAIFVATSLPNAEPFAVERTILRLESIVAALNALDPGFGLPGAQVIELLHNVEEILAPLRDFAVEPPRVVKVKPPVLHLGLPHRPTYVIDLDWLEAMRWNGSSWGDLAMLLNVSRVTLYNHMRAEGRLTKRPYTDISNTNLDNVIREIVLLHPFAGAVIVSGHLASRGIKVPLLRVQTCLKRVDPIGVMLRYTSSVFYPDNISSELCLAFDLLLLALGVLSSEECTTCVERIRSGTMMVMRSCDLGGSMCTAVSMGFRDLLSISTFLGTKRHPPSPKCSNEQQGNLGFPVGSVATLEPKTTVWRSSCKNSEGFLTDLTYVASQLLRTVFC